MPQIKDFTIEKEAAENGDFLVLQSPEGETYIITRENFLAGLTSGGGTSGGGTVTDTDVLFSDVVLLLSNDGTVLLDKSSLGNALSNSGVVLSELISKFGSNSAYFGGGTNILTIPHRNEFNLGNEFTVEGWVYPTTLDGNPRYIISKVGDLSSNSSRSYGLNITTTGIQWYFTENGISDNAVNFPCTITANTWHHVAVSRKDGVLYGFFDRVLIASVPHTVNYAVVASGVTIGSFGGYAANGYPQLSFIGNLEKNGLRITKKCRYTDTFVLPVKAFPTS